MSGVPDPAHRPISPLLYSARNGCRLACDEQGVGAMRAIIQGLTDAEFERLYGTEERCLAALAAARQAAGMPCPRCGNPKSYVYPLIGQLTRSCTPQGMD